MEITFLGGRSFRLRGKEVSVITDPNPLAPGQPPSKLQADIVTVSHDGQDAAAAAVGGEPRVLAGPGEYEIRNVLIAGVATFRDAEQGKKAGRNTVYVLTFEDLRLCHLGDLGHVLSTEQVDEIGTVDVLFVPALGTALETARAAEVISQIEALGDPADGLHRLGRGGPGHHREVLPRDGRPADRAAGPLHREPRQRPRRGPGGGAGGPGLSASARRRRA